MPQFIQHFSSHRDLLSYDVATGAHQRISRRQLPRGRALDRGFFVDVNEHLFGVVASPDGPVFFRDAAMTRLVQGTHTAHVSREGASHHFSLHEDGVEILAVKFVATEPSYANPYDQEEEDSDFLCSLPRNLASAHFYRWYTQAPVHRSAYGEYLWVWDRQASEFVARYRVLAAGERAEDLPDGAALQGTVPAKDADAFFETLRAQFAAPRYECSSTNATSWEVVAKQARPLRDYDAP